MKSFFKILLLILLFLFSGIGILNPPPSGFVPDGLDKVEDETLFEELLTFEAVVLPLLKELLVEKEEVFKFELVTLPQLVNKIYNNILKKLFIFIY